MISNVCYKILFINFIFFFFKKKRVKQRESENLMTAKNLSVVFGPTLLRGPNPQTEILDMNYKNSTIEYMIEHTNALFPKAIESREDGFI